MTPDRARHRVVAASGSSRDSDRRWSQRRPWFALIAILFASTAVLATVVARTNERDLTVGRSPGASVFVAPSAEADGDGTLQRPFDLATALSAEGPVRPGATLWLRGGTYSGTFRSDLTGTAEHPIVVRSYPGERAIIDSAPFNKPALSAYGAWTTYRDFELFSSSASRESAQEDGSQPSDLARGPGIAAHGPHTVFANLVVHDLAGGIDIWSDAVDAEARGNVIYNNGWKAGERSNGHGIYTQNQYGVRTLADNVIFNQFAAGIHAYGSDAAYLDNIRLEGNVLFNNGVLGGRYDRNILIGGGRIAHHPALVGNHTYFSIHGGLKFGQNNVGYLAGCDNLDAHDNVFVAGEFGFALEFVNCGGVVRQNRFIGEVRAVDGKVLTNEAGVRSRFPDNAYLESPASGVDVFVRPASFERGRATIIVYNWGRHKFVDVDLAKANLERGARFEILDAENVLGDPVASGAYDGSVVSLPMTNLSVARPIGDGVGAPSHTGPDFAVFIVTRASERPSLVARAVAALHRLL
jgi:hypothetical protein